MMSRLGRLLLVSLVFVYVIGYLWIDLSVKGGGL